MKIEGLKTMQINAKHKILLLSPFVWGNPPELQ